MRRSFLLLLLPLVACATPREQCIANAGKELRVISGLVAETQANITRGYALRTEKYFENEPQVCGVIDGEEVYCDIPVARSREVPVAIDLNAEATKLQSLKIRQSEMAARTDAIIAECKLLHPET